MGKHCVKYKKKFCPRFKISARSILISNMMLTTEPKLFPFTVRGADNFYKYFLGNYHYSPPREIVTRKILNDKKIVVYRWYIFKFIFHYFLGFHHLALKVWNKNVKIMQFIINFTFQYLLNFFLVEAWFMGKHPNIDFLNFKESLY